jgi:hypothetical protein
MFSRDQALRAQLRALLNSPRSSWTNREGLRGGGEVSEIVSDI